MHLKVLLSQLIALQILCVYSGYTQQVKVVDKSTLQPIENVAVYSSDHAYGVNTNDEGVANLSEFKKSDIITFQHPSYNNVSLLYTELSSLEFKVSLSEKVINIDEVIISANKWEQNSRDIPNEIAKISPKEITFRNPQTSADLLESSGQVFVQKSQLGGGSPMIRGFAANSVLIVVDGIRMNNAIFRSGNLQNVISIDPNILSGAEVVFGPGSVIYGSDALGGVMDFHTKDPVFGTEGKIFTGGSAFTRYSTANNEKTGHVDFTIGGNRLSSLTSLSFSDFDDLRTGSDRTDDFPDFGKRVEFVKRINGEDKIIQNDEVNVQKFSGYNQWNLLQKVKYRPNDFMDITYNFQYSTTSDIPRYDRLIEYVDGNGDPATPENGTLESAEWFYGPQKWMLNALKTSWYNNNMLYDQAKITLAWQDVEESRNDRKFGSNRLRTRTEKVDVYSITIDLDKSISEKHQLFYGLEGIFNRVESDAIRTNINDGTVSPASTRYPDGGSNYNTFAAYLSHKWNINPLFILSSGVRFSQVNLKARVTDQSALDFPFDKLEVNNGAVNGSLGLVYLPRENLQFNFLLSSGFRAPNVDDVGKVFDSEPGVVIVPNAGLGPEYSYNAEAGFDLTIADFLRLGGVGFYSIVDNAMVRRDFSFNGEDSIVYDGNLLKVEALVNTGSAYIYGFNFDINADINNNLGLRSTVTFTKGRDKDDDVPLRHVSPLFGQTSLIYKASKFKSEFYIKYNGKIPFEDLAPSEQSKIHLYTADGALAWYTLNLRGSYQINEAFQLNGGVENILDRHYRPYSSGISAPGRNFIVSVKASF